MHRRLGPGQSLHRRLGPGRSPHRRLGPGRSLGPDRSRRTGWGCSSSGGLVKAGLWTGDEEPGGASPRGPILGGGDEVARGMVREYGGRSSTIGRSLQWRQEPQPLGSPRGIPELRTVAGPRTGAGDRTGSGERMWAGPGPGSRTRVTHPTLDGGDGIWEGARNRCLGPTPMGTHLTRDEFPGHHPPQRSWPRRPRGLKVQGQTDCPSQGLG